MCLSGDRAWRASAAGWRTSWPKMSDGRRTGRGTLRSAPVQLASAFPHPAFRRAPTPPRPRHSTITRFQQFPKQPKRKSPLIIPFSFIKLSDRPILQKKEMHLNGAFIKMKSRQNDTLRIKPKQRPPLEPIIRNLSKIEIDR